MDVINGVGSPSATWRWRLEESVNGLAGAGEGWHATMATKPQKSLRGSIDDVLDDLLRYDDEPPVTSARASQLAGGSSGRARGTSSQASKKSFLEDDSSANSLQRTSRLQRDPVPPMQTHKLCCRP